MAFKWHFLSLKEDFYLCCNVTMWGFHVMQSKDRGRREEGDKNRQKTELMSLQGTRRNVRYVWALHANTRSHIAVKVWMGLSGLVFTHSSDISVCSVHETRCSCWDVFFVCVCVAGPGSNPSTSAQVDGEVILSLPSSARCSAVVFSSSPLFVSVWRPEVRPSVSGWLEIPVPTLLKFHCSDQSHTSAKVM